MAAKASRSDFAAKERELFIMAEKKGFLPDSEVNSLVIGVSRLRCMLTSWQRCKAVSPYKRAAKDGRLTLG
jgi:hypothetical protein